MSGTKSNYLQGALQNHVLGGPTFSQPGTVYVALYTAVPTAAGGGTEVSGGAYARAAVTNNSANWPASSGGSPASKSNGTVLTFTTATADWGTVVAFGLFDASTNGNLLLWATLTESKAVYNGDTPSFQVGALAWNET